MKRTLRGRESGGRPTGGCRRPVRARCRIRWRRCCRRGSDARRRRAGRQPAPSGCAACRAPGRRAAGSCRRPCRSCLCPRRRGGGCSGCPDLPPHAAAARPEGPASPFEIFQPVVFRGGGVVAEEEVDADAFAAAERVDRYGEEPAVARRSAPHGGVMRFAERADEAAGALPSARR